MADEEGQIVQPQEEEMEEVAQTVQEVGGDAEEKKEEEEESQDWGEDVSLEKDGGVWKKILVEGSGSALPGKGDEVSVHYVGRLLTGEIFDSSQERGDFFTFKLGAGNVIKGWDIGVATMKKGEKCLLTCKSEYAYGEQGSPPKIGPNATLQFEVELYQWAGEDITKDGGVIKTVLVKGEGVQHPSDGSACKVLIRGTHNGREFEEREVSYEQGEGSECGLVEGVEKAVAKMKKLEVASVEVRAEYAYGESGSTELGIPPNADLTYEITLSDFQKAKRPWEYDDIEERRTDAEKLKAKGNAYFKEGKFSLALKVYDRGYDLVGDNVITDDSEKNAVKDLLVSLQLNKAACHLKLREPTLVLKECEEVLKVDIDNVKAYFRKGQARELLQDYDEAMADYQSVLKVESTNRAAVARITWCKNQMKASHEREKKIYANMFEKFAAKDVKQAPSEPEQALSSDEDTAGEQREEPGMEEPEWKEPEGEEPEGKQPEGEEPEGEEPEGKQPEGEEPPKEEEEEEQATTAAEA